MAFSFREQYKRHRGLIDFLLRMTVLMLIGTVILLWMKSVPGLQSKIVNSTAVYYFGKVFISLSHQLIGWFGYESTYGIIRLSNMEYVAELCTPSFDCLYLAWPCLGIKVTGVFISLILVFPGKDLHKLWFLPLGIVLIQVFNVLRFSILLMIVYHYPMSQITDFNLLNLGIGYHDLFNFVLYLVIFGLFVFWIQFFGIKPRANSNFKNPNL